MTPDPQFLSLLQDLKTSDRIPTLLQELQDIHNRKNAGYSGAENKDAFSNFRLAEMFGVPAPTGVLVRMSDKFSRSASLIRQPGNEQVGENLDDTLIDLAAYALIAVCLLREARTKGYRVREWLNGLLRLLQTGKRS